MEISGKIDLRTLASGVAPGLTSYQGGSLAEAASVCLEYNNHTCGVQLDVTGDTVGSVDIDWQPCTQQMRDTHADMFDAAEQGACGVAIELMNKCFGKTVVQRSWKGKDRDYGFDYWLGDGASVGAGPFAKDTRLEVSGILEGNSSDFARRAREKLAQVRRSKSAYPGVAVVVMFSRPVAKIEHA